jgi:hypothetical protein
MTTEKTVSMPLAMLHSLETHAESSKQMSRALNLAIDGLGNSLLTEADLKGALSWLAFEVSQVTERLSDTIDAISVLPENKDYQPAVGDVK